MSLFAVALAGTGLLTTVGVIVSMDTFGPVSDNAQGIAEMSGDVHGEGAKVLTELDAVGNTTKAITKGIAIATAVLAATALFGSFNEAVATAIAKADPGTLERLRRAQPVDQHHPARTCWSVCSSAPRWSSCSPGLAINAVSRAAGAVIFEVRRQFREHPGIMDGTELPEYGRVVDIVTKDSLRELATPGLLAVLTPIARRLRPRRRGAGCLPGRRHRRRHADGGLPRQLGRRVGQREEVRRGRPLRRQGLRGRTQATVIGDTVGDPFKDTAGPAINPLIKVMNLVAAARRAGRRQALLRRQTPTPRLRVLIAVVAAAVVVVAVVHLQASPDRRR